MKRNKLKIFAITVFLLMVISLYFGVNNAENATDEEKLVILKDAVNRSALQCYAIEGYYPPNIDYLEKNYGLIVDDTKYIISYEIFASNIMPVVDVFSKK